jgi:ABC-2 type transport system permease protein
VNLEHLRAFLLLRWRLRYNQFRKAGAVNAVFFAIYIVLALVASVGLFVTGLLVGLFAMPHAPPAVRLYVWDGVVLVFLFFWLIGLLIELQRAEGLALDKILHLPVSPSGAFLVNYLSSLFSLTLIAFVPGMVGLILGQSISISPAMLLALPLLAAFILAITAVTYQFQGWLASLMTNKRRRRTVLFIATFSIILILQAPQLINVFRPWDDTVESYKRLQEKQTELQRDFASKKMSPQEFHQQQKELNERHQAERKEATQRQLAELERIARVANAILPIGWFPLGAAALPDNEFLPTLLGFLGLGLIGAFSLRRAYRTTVRPNGRRISRSRPPTRERSRWRSGRSRGCPSTSPRWRRPRSGRSPAPRKRR